MEGIIKKIKGIFPVTTTKAVYMDGTSKTLQDAIDNGEIGGGGSPSADVTITEKTLINDAYMYTGSVNFHVDAVSLAITLKLDTRHTLNRIFRVYYASGTASGATIGMMTAGDSITLEDGQMLYYDGASNTATVATAGGVTGNQVLIAVNVGGRITQGILAPLFAMQVRHRPDRLYRVRPTIVTRNQRKGGDYLHSMFAVGDKLCTLEVASGGNAQVYDLTQLDTGDLTAINSFPVSIKDKDLEGNDYELRLVCCDYSEDNAALVMGNSNTVSYMNGYMRGFIFYDAASWLEQTAEINFSTCGAYTMFDFGGQSETSYPGFNGMNNAKIVWDDVDPNCIMVTAGNAQRVFRVLLGKGANQLTYGTYSYIDANKFNGTYEVIDSWINYCYDYGSKDIVMTRGALWHPIKRNTGGFWWQADYMMENGTIRSDQYVYDPRNSTTGDYAMKASPEGCVEYKGKLIMSWAEGGAESRVFYVYDLP